MKKLRISAISYLNTAPLMWDFEHEDVGSRFDIAYTLPSGCAEALRHGSADIGIIPAAAYASLPGLEILPDIAIASKQPVRSILLVSKVQLEEIRSVALDTSSMTSVALVKVLFSRWWGNDVRFEPMAPKIDKMLATHDAGLVIGDPALRIDRSRYVTYDLAEEWIRLTGRPFVFAFWAIRRDALELASATGDFDAVFRRSRDHGLAADSLQRIVDEWAPRLGLDPSEVSSYLTESIHYYLDAACLEGLRLFYRYAEECGGLPHTPELHFLDLAKSCIK